MDIGHPSRELLVDYFGTRLTFEQDALIERHIADCEECAEQATDIFRVSYVLDNWKVARSSGE